VSPPILTDDQCTILTLRGQVTDLEGERDRALKRVEALEENLRKAGAEIAQMASEWHADKERVVALEKHIEEMNEDAGRYFERVKQAEARALQVPERWCTTCLGHGDRVAAAYVARDAHGGEWFECDGKHDPDDNLAGVERVARVPIAEWFQKLEQT
jgi:hypothetical protein